MKKIIAQLLTLIMLCSLSISVLADGIHWHAYSSDMFSKAKSSNHMIFLFAKSDECQWCKKMKSTTFTDSNVIAYINNNYYPVMFDAIKNAEVADKYQISELPAFIILNNNGETVKSLSGYMTADDFMSNLQANSNTPNK